MLGLHANEMTLPVNDSLSEFETEAPGGTTLEMLHKAEGFRPGLPAHTMTHLFVERSAHAPGVMQQGFDDRL